MNRATRGGEQSAHHTRAADELNLGATERLDDSVVGENTAAGAGKLERATVCFQHTSRAVDKVSCAPTRSQDQRIRLSRADRAVVSKGGLPDPKIARALDRLARTDR